MYSLSLFPAQIFWDVIFSMVCKVDNIYFSTVYRVEEKVRNVQVFRRAIRIGELQLRGVVE